MAASRPHVDIDDIAAHLNTLSAFRTLYHDLINKLVNESGFSPEMALTMMSNRAAYRFEAWLEKVAQDSGPLFVDERPSLDAALALHSMMLYPHRFYEDAQLRFPKLKRFQEFQHGSFTGDKTTGVSSFEKKTLLKYDPQVSLSSDSERYVTCPFCEKDVTVLWHTTNATGYVDESFSQFCSACGDTVNTDSLCVYKFLQALVAFTNNKTPLPYLAELAFSDRNADVVHAREATQCIKDAVPGSTTKEILDSAARKRLTGMEYIKSLLVNVQLTANRTVDQILRPFKHPYKFTQNLVPAMTLSLKRLSLLQADEVLAEAGGLTSEFALKEWYDLYVPYFNSLKTPGVHIGPPLRVDLIWHTHILKATVYREDCLAFLGIFPNHVPRNEGGVSVVTVVPDDQIMSILGEQRYLLQMLASNYKSLEALGTSKSWALPSRQPSTLKHRLNVPKAIINPTQGTSSSTTDLYNELATKVGEIGDIWQQLKEIRPVTGSLALSLIRSSNIVLPHARLADSYHALADSIMQLNEEHPEDKCQD
ncbi:hypothetical protein ONZ45_g7829 [Pleurotus djamor]|nr:hypothetical protein ONZ45_g7829 [Pleurotus djamor]